MTAHVLIVDDEADLRELIELSLMRMGLKTCTAGSVQEAKDWLKERAFQLCITDMRLPDGTGLELLKYINQHHAHTPTAMITAYGSADIAVESLKNGAFDFVSKPIDITVLRKLVDTALKLTSITSQKVTEKTDDGGILGQTPAIEHLRSLIDRLARSQAPVHISGESGTGKELVARLIHARSPRGQAPFVPINCGAIPSELMESEFFGHKKGSFTGAIKDKMGLFQAAEGGTLFLDEVADLPLHMQVKLLRALQERSVRPVGGESEVAVNVRVISATHKDLSQLLVAGLFRQDLYYRLNVIEVRTPPLRERMDDLPLLVSAILQRLAPEVGLQKAPSLSQNALQLLTSYAFPGNVRELENILERALTLCDGKQIQSEDLQMRQASHLPVSAPAMSVAVMTPVLAADNDDLESQMEQIEKKAIQEALEKVRYNKTKAAELLGMSFRSLRYRIKKLGLE
jgi:two-component system response regulator PilR (NtrC family)